MKKSIIAFSSLVTMAGFGAILVGAGCSDDSEKTGTAATEPEDQGTKAPPKTPPPSTPDDSAGDDDDDDTEGTALACMSKSEFDASTVAYHPPAVKPGSCTTADVKVFNDYVTANPTATVDDIREAVTKQSEKCSDCIFGASGDEKWAPIVQDETGATLNGGGCVSVVSGKEACGETYQKWNACINATCASCTDSDERSQCSQDAQNEGAPCGGLSQELFKSCGNKVNDYLKKCFNSGIGAVAEYLCGSTPAKDGGT